MAATQQFVSDGVKAVPVLGSTVFRSSAPVSTTGDSAIWTPPAGKIWWLLWYCIEVTADAAKSGGGTQVLALTLRDGATALGLVHSCYVPPAASASAIGLCYTTNQVILGPRGIAGTVAAQALNINLGFGLDTGKVRVRVGGIEL